MGLLTTIAGSFPKPGALKRARHARREGEIDRAALEQAEDRALAEVIGFQERAGLSVLTDGEIARGDLVGHYATRLEGLDEGQLVRCWGNRYVRRPRITGPVERHGPLVVDGWQRARALTQAPLRATVTGPYTLMQWSFDEFYGSRRDCAEAFAVAVAAEVGELAAAGAQEIQLDEPALGTIPAETAWAVELAGRIAEAGGESRLWMHVAFAEPAPDWEALAALPGDYLMVGLAHHGLHAADGLGALAADTTLVAGVIDAIDPAVESVDEIGERVEGVLRHVPADRLMLSTDAGLRGLSEETARRKVERLVEAAERF